MILIYVIEISCDPLLSDESIEVTCSHENRFGSECTFVCAHAHRLTGSESATCERNDADPLLANWDYGDNAAPECTRK